MRRARIVYPESYHHVMSRGYDGNYIFKNGNDKNYFLDLLNKFSLRRNISVLAWCVLDNHVLCCAKHKICYV